MYIFNTILWKEHSCNWNALSSIQKCNGFMTMICFPIKNQWFQCEYTYLNGFFGFFGLEILKYTYLNGFFGFFGFDSPKLKKIEIDCVESQIYAFGSQNQKNQKNHLNMCNSELSNQKNPKNHLNMCIRIGIIEFFIRNANIFANPLMLHETVLGRFCRMFHGQALGIDFYLCEYVCAWTCACARLTSSKSHSARSRSFMLVHKENGSQSVPEGRRWWKSLWSAPLALSRQLALRYLLTKAFVNSHQQCTNAVPEYVFCCKCTKIAFPDKCKCGKCRICTSGMWVQMGAWAHSGI